MMHQTLQMQVDKMEALLSSVDGMRKMVIEHYQLKQYSQSVQVIPVRQVLQDNPSFFDRKPRERKPQGVRPYSEAQYRQILQGAIDDADRHPLGSRQRLLWRMICNTSAFVA